MDLGIIIGSILGVCLIGQALIMYVAHRDKKDLKNIFVLGTTVKHIKTNTLWEVFKVYSDVVYVRKVGSYTTEKAITIVNIDGIVQNHLTLQWEKM